MIPRKSKAKTNLTWWGKQGKFKAIGLTTLGVGVADGVAASLSAFLKATISPTEVFRYVASALFGYEAYTGGNLMVVAGVTVHMGVTLGWTFLYFQLYPKLPNLRSYSVSIGMMYGICILLSMRYLILPLTRLPVISAGMLSLSQLVIHMFIIGVPIVWCTHRYFAEKAEAKRPFADFEWGREK